MPEPEHTSSYKSNPRPQPSKPKTESIDISKPCSLTRHPDLSFDDGDLAVPAGSFYFLLHSEVICRQSIGLSEAANTPDKISLSNIEGRSVTSLILDDSRDDLFFYFRSMYNGISEFSYDSSDFDVVSSILRLATKYRSVFLRDEMIEGLSRLFPRTLSSWDIREIYCTSTDGEYEAGTIAPHPILVINLARLVDAPQLLPSAFYDLSRRPASHIASGAMHPTTGEMHDLSDEDLRRALKGKEISSRFLSSFILNELDRFVCAPSLNCSYRFDRDIKRSLTCQLWFSRILYELVRDVFGMVCGRTPDELFAILDTLVMLTKDNDSAMHNTSPCGNSELRICSACCSEYASVVDTTREQFWQMLPLFFLDMDTWP